METVGIRKLKNHLSEYVRRVRAGESIGVSFHGELVAELRPPEASVGADEPAGLRELRRRGTIRNIVRNEAARYRSYQPALARTSGLELLDLDRGVR